MVVNSQNIRGNNFSWNSTVNLSINRNKIVSLYGDLDENGKEVDDFTNQWFIGQDINAVWDYEITGVYKTTQAAEADAYGVFPGDFILNDVNGDGVYTRDDKKFLGYSTPRARWTFVNNVTLYKNLTISVEMYSQMGQLTTFNDAKNRNGFIDRTSSLVTPYWTEDNQIDDWARLFSSDGGVAFNVYRNSSFVRIQNVTVSYNIPQAILDRVKVKALRVYGNIRNLAVIAPDWEVFDPEARDVDGSDGRGPTPRYFTLGLNLSL
ncbi:MAG: hypothetical protein ACFHWX_12260 [Bacteroidota bacterium]